jgi:hypothetical protein
MKKIMDKDNAVKAICMIILLIAGTASAHCQKNWEAVPVNVREIGLDSISELEISFHRENLTLLQGNSDHLVVKEFRNSNKSKFFARIINEGNKLSVKRGWWLSWRIFSIVRSRIEIYLPGGYKNITSVRVTNGNIEITGKYECSNINVNATSGAIVLNISRDDCFNLSFQTVSGKLSVPFIEKLSGKKSQQFTVGESNSNKNIHLKTVSGNINVQY